MVVGSGGIGEGWARFTYGGSTGGWEALAVQVLYPVRRPLSDGALKTRCVDSMVVAVAVQDEFNGCFAACPDPIDFRACERAQTHRACLCRIKTIDPTCLILRAFIARHLSCCHEPQAPTNTSPR